MPHVPASPHADHDRLLVAAYAAGDATGADLETAQALVAACADCAVLHRDLRSIAGAVAALPAPARSRDYRLTPTQAASLRPPAWRRLLQPFAGPRFAFAGPLGTGLATLGIAGLLLAGPLSMPFAASTPAAGGERTGGGVAATEAPAGQAPAMEPEAQAASPGVLGFKSLEAASPTPGVGPAGEAGAEGDPAGQAGGDGDASQAPALEGAPAEEASAAANAGTVTPVPDELAADLGEQDAGTGNVLPLLSGLALAVRAAHGRASARRPAPRGARLTEPGAGSSRQGRVMPHVPPSPHADHDRLLVAAYAAGDATGADLETAQALVAACADCAVLHRDLRSIAGAVAALPAPARSRDYRLTPTQAASLRPPAWRRLLQPLAGPRFAFAGPLGTGLATLGIAGLLLAGPLGMPFAASAPAAGGAPGPEVAGAPVDQSRVDGVESEPPMFVAPAPSAAPSMVGAAAPGASPGPKGSEAPERLGDGIGGAPQNVGTPGSETPGGTATQLESARSPLVPAAPGGVGLFTLAATLLGIGIGLGGLRLAARRLT